MLFYSTYRTVTRSKTVRRLKGAREEVTEKAKSASWGRAKAMSTFARVIKRAVCYRLNVRAENCVGWFLDDFQVRIFSARRRSANAA